jgi:hypothetical protein
MRLTRGSAATTLFVNLPARSEGPLSLEAPEAFEFAKGFGHANFWTFSANRDISRRSSTPPLRLLAQLLDQRRCIDGCGVNLTNLRSRSVRAEQSPLLVLTKLLYKTRLLHAGGSSLSSIENRGRPFRFNGCSCRHSARVNSRWLQGIPRALKRFVAVRNFVAVCVP